MIMPMSPRASAIAATAPIASLDELSAAPAAAVSVNDGLFAVGVARSSQNCALFEHGISPCSETVAAELLFSDSPMTIIA